MLGAEHDGTFSDCGSTDNQLMGPALDKKNPEKLFILSCCSIATIYNELSGLMCLANPAENNTVIDFSSMDFKQLGELITRDEICKQVNGETYEACEIDDVNAYTNLTACQGVYCKKQGSVQCKQYKGSGVPTLNGMGCDEVGDNWCMHGECVPKNQTAFRNDEQRNCDVTRRPLQKVPIDYNNNDDKTQVLKEKDKINDDISISWKNIIRIFVSAFCTALLVVGCGLYVKHMIQQRVTRQVQVQS